MVRSSEKLEPLRNWILRNLARYEWSLVILWRVLVRLSRDSIVILLMISVQRHGRRHFKHQCSILASRWSRYKRVTFVFKFPFLTQFHQGNPITTYPEWSVLLWFFLTTSDRCIGRSYNSTISGPSGNITVNGTATYACGSTNSSSLSLNKRGIGAGNQSGVDVNSPPYAIHNGMPFDFNISFTL